MASNPAAPSAELLRALVEVGYTGSIAGAARVLGLTQQAVSGRIRSLEAAAGVSVLHRGTGGSTLTDAGALIANWAEDLLAAHDRLAAGLRTLVATLVSAPSRRVDVSANDEWFADGETTVVRVVLMQPTAEDAVEGGAVDADMPLMDAGIDSLATTELASRLEAILEDPDASISPNGTEIPDDGIDQDCDGADSTTTVQDDYTIPGEYTYAVFDLTGLG